VERRFTVDLWRLLKGGDVRQDLFLQDRDTIVIPTAAVFSAAESIQVATASFSPDSMRVNIVGEVKQPRAVKMPPNTPLNQAVLAAQKPSALGGVGVYSDSTFLKSVPCV
jgi:polysaccharide biosynthesis/export protein